MTDPASSRTRVRFGVFEVDLQAGELRRQGMKIRLQEKPFQVLAQLLEQPSEVVTREELQKRLWPTDTFVDFDHGLNIAVAKLREALGDSADTPRFVETLPRRGYRFIYPVEVGGAGAETAARTLGRRVWGVGVAAVALFFVLGAGLVGLNVGGLRDRLRGGPAPGEIRSIGVLPLENLSRDPEQEYFADGMTEALITELAKISTLRVISRQSVMQFKGTSKPLPEIARELQVDALVEGSAMREGDRVRITAQLIQAVPERHLWAGSFHRELRDVLSVHSEVARAIASEVKVALTPREVELLSETDPLDPQAQEFYFRGRYEWTRRGEQGFDRAIQLFQQAIEKEPGYARAYAGLADVYVAQPSWGLAPPSEGYPHARAMALKALELNENLAEPHATLGFVKEQYDRDWSGAEQEYRRALELNPNYATGHHMYGMYLSFVGKHEQAIAELESAAKLDPLAPNIGTWLGGVLFYARRYDQAVQQLQRTARMHPEFSDGFVWLAIITYERTGMYAEALAAADKYSGPLEDPSYAFVGWVYGRTGRDGKAQAALGRLRERSKQRYIDSGALAMIYIGLGKKEDALKWLERAYEQRGSYLIRMLKVDPAWDPLRGDPRFQNLQQRMNFPD